MKVSRIVFLIVFVVFFALSPPLHAQQADERPAEEQPADDQAKAPAGKFAGEVTVTAQKREEALIEIPISIKAVTSDTLDMIGAQSLADVARLVPSMSMTDLSRGGNNVQIRGLGSNVGNVGTVALYNDGIVSALRTSGGSTFSEQDSTLYDVERVEVLRGPQGTLYGEGSFGGVINFISKRPDPQQFAASFSGDFFSIQDGDSSNYNVAAMVNIPLVTDKWALRVVAHSSDRGGYVDAVDALPVFFGAPGELVQEDANTEKFYGGRMLLGYRGEKVFATLIAKTQTTELGINNFTSPTTIDFVNTLGGTSFDTELSQAIFGPTYGSENTINEMVLDVNVVTPIGMFTSITGYGDIDAEGFTDPGSTVNNEAFSQEFRLSSESSGAVNFTVGAYYRSSEQTVELGPGGGIPFFNQGQDQYSLYGQLYWDISDVVRATLGVSYSDFDVDVTDQLNGLPTATNAFDDVSPKIALNWQPTDATNAYISAAKGFRVGGANVDESLGTDPLFRQGFDSDEIWNYEVGLKKIFMGGSVALNTAVFYIDWSNIQIDSPIGSVINPPVQFIVLNGEGAHSYGIEADLYWNPGKGWDIVLGGSVLEPEFDSGVIDSLDGIFELKGQTLPSAPRELWNASITKTFPIGRQGLNGFVRADYSHRGNSFSDVPNQRGISDFNSGEFDLVNLRFGVNRDSWEFQIFGKNLTNEDATAFNFNDGLFHFRARIAPLTVGVNVKFFYN